MGYFLLKSVPENQRPSIHMSVRLIKGVAAAVPVLLFVPVIRLIETLYVQFSIPLLESIATVVFEYSAGQAFLVSIFLTVAIIFSTPVEKWSRFSVFLVVGLVLAASWSSHGSAVAGWVGFIGNALHLLAVSIWIGVLAIVAWFAREWEQHQSFYRWFSVTAVFAVIVLIGSGFLLMAAIVPQYVQSWLLSYGQILFIKHLLFLPLLLFGLHHLILGLRVRVGPSTNQIKSFRIESLFAFVIFLLSAIMTEQTPPHEVAQVLQTESVSFLMNIFLEQSLNVQMVQIVMTAATFVLLAIAVGLFTYASYSLIRSYQYRKATSFFLISIVFIYVGLMGSVDVSEGERDLTVYGSIEEAVEQTYGADTHIDVLHSEYVDEEVYVIYMVDESDLVAEKLLSTEGGYNRLPNAMLTIGGTAVIEEDQKIRTFRVRSGNWHNGSNTFTYVTFGMIRKPSEIARVQIHYEGGSYIAELEQNVFINVVSTNEDWADQHPIDFLASDGQLIETYARNIMEEGVYCH
ncbi:copper resistance D family protein [Halalkalibacter krulwichiae]|nr:CopD family protein [Halalkalibacter krulwichiae]